MPRRLATGAERLLEDAGLGLDEIDFLLPPKGSADFATALADVLRVPEGRIIAPRDSREDAYTSSIPLGLHALSRRGDEVGGTTALMLTCGSGIQVGTAIYRF